MFNRKLYTTVNELIREHKQLRAKVAMLEQTVNYFVKQRNEFYPIEHKQRLVQVSADQGGSIYSVKYMYYDFDADDWAVKDKEWDLDAVLMSSLPSIGDTIVAYWDRQRGMFIPIVGGSGIAALEFTLTAALTTSTSSATATVDRNYNAGEPNIGDAITVYNPNSFGGGYRFAGTVGKKGQAIYDKIREQWMIIQLDC